MMMFSIPTHITLENFRYYDQELLLVCTLLSSNILLGLGYNTSDNCCMTRTRVGS